MIAIRPWTPLLVAAYTGDHLTVETLLAAKGDPNEVDELGRTALIHAAAQGHPRVVDALIKAGTDVTFSPSTDERTALHWAAFHGHQECCDLLQDAGCEVTEVDSQGLTPQDLGILGGVPFLLLQGDRSLNAATAASLRIKPSKIRFSSHIVEPPPAPPPEMEEEENEVAASPKRGRRGSVIARAQQAAMLANTIKQDVISGKNDPNSLASSKTASSKPGNFQTTKSKVLLPPVTDSTFSWTATTAKKATASTKTEDRKSVV